MTLQELRKQNHLTQKEASELIGVPYRTYTRYEQDSEYFGTFKYQMIYDALDKRLLIDEEHGLLSIDRIKELLIPILNKYETSYCYLFGSYAKGTARENSDIDLLVDTNLTGFKLFGFIEEIRIALHKKVDLIRLKDLQNTNPIVLEILKDGIRMV